MHAKYAATCKCGRRIQAGELMYYDCAIKRVLCAVCGKGETARSIKRVAKIQNPTIAQGIIDRISQLEALPQPLGEENQEELKRLGEQLKECAKGDQEVRRKLLHDRNTGKLVLLNTRFAGHCHKCKAFLYPGEPVAFDVNIRKMYCYQCVPEAS